MYSITTMKMIKILVLGLALFVSTLCIYLYQYNKTALDTGAAMKKIEFDLARGMKPFEIAMSLEKAGVLKHGKLFYWMGKVTQAWNGIKAADYELNSGMTPDQIFKTLRSGIGIQHSILIREGENLYQVADSFEATGLGKKEAVIRLLKSSDFIAGLGLGEEGLITLEGYLYPNTYFYDKHDALSSVIKRMVDAFQHSWNPEYDARARELGMNRRQVVTLASMIEKETGASFERPIISAVFHNRLKKHMKLQSDPTTIYGMWERYTGKIHKSDLLERSAYNTYTIPALPPGPISNPHPGSIKAALFPATEVDALYFVSKNDGTHVFSRTYEEHNHWVKKLQLDPKAREGKSWRDLKQNNEAH